MTTVCVNDGNSDWTADLDALLGALDRLGWEEVPGYGWNEPPYDPETEDGATRYTELCAEVTTLGDSDDDTIPTLVYRPDIGDGAWRWNTAPEATATRVEPRFTVGDKIIAGDTDEEREDGTIIEIDGDRALIAWRQGTRTWIDLDDCEAA